MKKSMIFVTILGLCGLMQAQTITVTSPNGLEKWPIGSTQGIRWNSAGLSGNVKIGLFKGGTHIGNIVEHQPYATGVDWHVGDPLVNGVTYGAGTDYQIQVQSEVNWQWKDLSDNNFTITTGVQQATLRPVISDRGQFLLKFPKLEVTGIDLVPYPDGTVNVIFAYKNTGTAPLPRRSEFAVQPDFRVVVDGRELAKGDLFIPENPPAPPGWEVTTHFGGSIKFPLASANYVSETGFAYGDFFIGDSITVHINERKAGGMDPSSLTLNLRNMSLKFGYDLMISSREYDWATKTLKIQLRIVGKWDHGSNVRLSVTLANVTNSGDHFDLKADPLITVTKKYNVPDEEKFADFKIWTSIQKKINEPVWEVDLRNNTVAVSFRRPAL